jgi:guanine deaminase
MTSLTRDEEFLGRAIELAEQSVRDGAGGPFGAVVVFEDVILAEGRNLVTASHDPTAHAEVVAIRRACEIKQDYRLPGCTVYASTEPCPMCLAAIYWSRAARVVFAASRVDAACADFDDEEIYRELARPLDRRTLPISQLKHPHALSPFELWGASAHSVRY